MAQKTIKVIMDASLAGNLELRVSKIDKIVECVYFLLNGDEIVYVGM